MGGVLPGAASARPSQEGETTMKTLAALAAAMLAFGLTSAATSAFVPLHAATILVAA